MATLNVRRFSDPDFLRLLAPEDLLLLLEPHRAHLERRGWIWPDSPLWFEVGYLELAAILMAPSAETPPELAECLHAINEMSTERAMDRLLAVASRKRIDLGLGEQCAPSEVAALMMPGMLRAPSVNELVPFGSLNPVAESWAAPSCTGTPAGLPASVVVSGCPAPSSVDSARTDGSCSASSGGMLPSRAAKSAVIAWPRPSVPRKSERLRPIVGARERPREGPTRMILASARPLPLTKGSLAFAGPLMTKLTLRVRSPTTARSRGTLRLVTDRIS